MNVLCYNRLTSLHVEKIELSELLNNEYSLICKLNIHVKSVDIFSCEAKLNFQHYSTLHMKDHVTLLQSSVSHDPSEIILNGGFIINVRNSCAA